MTSDKDRLGDGDNTNDWYSSRGALYDTLREDELQDAILLILYNKTDLVSHTSEAELKTHMDALFNIEAIQKTVACLSFLDGLKEPPWFQRQERTAPQPPTQ